MQILKKAWFPIVVLGLAGAGLCAWLYERHGFRDVGAAVVAAGWGLAAVVAFHLVPLVCDATSWRALIPARQRLPWTQLVWIRWMGDSVSSMLPVAQVGGEVVRVRVSALRGMHLSVAIATVLVGITISVFTQIIFTLTGLALLLMLSGRTGLTRPILAGSGLGVLAAGGFYYFQRKGMFRFGAVIISHLKKSAGWRDLIKDGEAVDAEIRETYQRTRSLMACSFWNMACWLTGAVEVWIALHALGVKATYTQSYVLESMSQGIRSAAFLIPGALGVQEGGFLLIGALLGIAAPTAMALALIRRVRELAFGLPGVMAWQWFEWRRYWERNTEPNASGTASPSADQTPG